MSEGSEREVREFWNEVAVEWRVGTRGGSRPKWKSEARPAAKRMAEVME